MKLASFCIIFSACLCAQSQAPAQTPAQPGTPTVTVTPVTPGTLPAAPAPKKETPPETVVAQINRKDWTAGEVTKLLSEFPPQAHKAFSPDPARTPTSILITQ